MHLRRYRVQRTYHTDHTYEAAEPTDALAFSALEAATHSFGMPHGTPHLWARVWCLSTSQAWRFDGIGRVVHEEIIRARWG